MSGQMTNDESKRMSEWKKRHLIPSLMLCGFVSLLLIVSASASVIQVEHQYVTKGDTFTANVDCFPSQPLKAWEFRVVYDPLMLQLIGIEEGDFFDGYQTFFIANGSITYDLIVGHGNVSEPGVLVGITFTALQEGVTTVSLAGAGVCNESMYVPLSVVNGTVHVAGVTGLRSQKELRHGWNSFSPYTWKTITSLRIAMMILFHRF